MRITLTNNTYDFIKRIVTITLPALCTLLYTVAKLWGFDLVMVANIIGTINAFVAFFGAIMGISSSNYNNVIVNQNEVKNE